MKRLLAAFLALSGTVAVACYQDDALHPNLIAPTKVFLTDDPFPFDTVGSVNIYISKIEGSTQFDTSGAGSWVEIAAPKKGFDLLTLQQGTTAPLGGQPIEAGQYVAIRMTINVDQSSIKYKDGTDAMVHWPYPFHGEVVLYALVEQTLAVSPSGAEIVIDFDVGRSFIYNLYGGHDFIMQTTIRAVNSAATGAIAGDVTGPDIEGNPTPIQNANVTVYGGDPLRPSSTWYVVATGRTDATGHYKVAFLPTGTWIVQFEQPDLPGLDPVTTPGVHVTAGDTVTESAFLPRAGAGGTFLRISGPDTVGLGGTIVLLAAVGDSNGIPEQSPQVTWSSRDTSIALVLQDSTIVSDSVSHGVVLGRGVGWTWIVARSGSLQDSIAIQVVDIPPSLAVASVTVSPATLSLAVGDSSLFTATPRDSAGNVLTNRFVQWYLTDSALVVTLGGGSLPYNETQTVVGAHAGTTTLRALIEGKVGSATITVH